MIVLLRLVFIRRAQPPLRASGLLSSSDCGSVDGVFPDQRDHHGRGGRRGVRENARSFVSCVASCRSRMVSSATACCIATVAKYLPHPLSVVVLALGSADLMFAFDSIPAIFGITSQAFLVFACNVFALITSFLLVDALLGKLVYLGYGLGDLSFIGIKLILEAFALIRLSTVAGDSVGARDLRVVSLGVIVVL